MKDFYFTFGSVHFTKEGVCMYPYYVRVTAIDYATARYAFIEKFSSVHMHASDRWAFQYEEDQFEFKYFPGGEYQHITTQEEHIKT